MGLTIKFYFDDAADGIDAVDGETLDALSAMAKSLIIRMNQAAFHAKILPHLTENESDNWYVSDSDRNCIGAFVTKIWQICKQCGFVEPEDDRIPSCMKFFKTIDEHPPDLEDETPPDLE